jgi:hypothetical protein
MYDTPTYLIASTLFLGILLAYETGFRIGKFHQQRTDHEIKAQTINIQGSVLGLLALLLAFTFNMSLQRYDARSAAVVQEANAIGTTVLRTKLLPPPYDKTLYDLLQDYIDIRIEVAQVPLSQDEKRGEIIKRGDELSKNIWDVATEAAKSDPNPVTTGLFMAALNDMIDSELERIEIQNRHIPEVILYLLFFVFVITGAIMGYSGGLGMKRAYIPTALLTLLIVLIVYIIIDLDRPKRGLITVNQDYILQLKNQ